jgi:HSP20 family protein
MRTVTLRRSSDPWAELAKMQRDLLRLMGDWEPTSRPSAYPPANLYRSDDRYELRLEVPGVDPTTLELTTLRQELTVKGERRAPELPEGAGRQRAERRYGAFRRTFVLPDDADSDRVEAHYRDGVLVLLVPTKAEARPRQISLTRTEEP